MAHFRIQTGYNPSAELVNKALELYRMIDQGQANVYIMRPSQYAGQEFYLQTVWIKSRVLFHAGFARRKIRKSFLSGAKQVKIAFQLYR